MGLFKPNIKKMKSNGEIKELISLLNTEDEKVRGDASKALSELDSTAVEMLIETLRDSEGAFRALVVTTLSKIGAPAVEPLIITLDNIDEDMQIGAAYTLGEIFSQSGHIPEVLKKEDKAVDALTNVIENRDSFFVRDAAINALAKIGPTAVEPLVELLSSDDSDLHLLVPRALGRIGDKRAVDPLLQRLDDSSNDLQRVIILTLGEIGDDRAVDPLQKLFWGKNMDYETKDMLAKTLNKLGHPVDFWEEE